MIIGGILLVLQGLERYDEDWCAFRLPPVTDPAADMDSLQPARVDPRKQALLEARFFGGGQKVGQNNRQSSVLNAHL